MAKVNLTSGQISRDISGKRKSMSVISSSTTILSMTEMSLSCRPDRSNK